MPSPEVTREKKVSFYQANADAVRPRIIVGAEQELIQYRQESATRIWYNDLTTDYQAHWHNALEIIVPVENWYDATIFDEVHHLVPGDIMVIPSGEIHSLHAPETGHRFIFLFDISLLTKIHGFSAIQPIIAQPLHITRATFPNIYDDLYQILVQIRNEYFSQNEFAELSIYSLLLNFFVKLGANYLDSINLFPNMRVHKQKEYVEKFNSVMDYIDAHYMDDLNLDDIAGSIGFSKYHFSRLFKQYTNYTFGAYITHRRIKVAEQLLSEPDISITKVALQSGFPSISTFNRVFKQVKNCTPSEFRDIINQYRGR